MRGAGHLPASEAVGVGLAGTGVAEASGDVGLGGQHEDGHVEVLAEQGRARRGDVGLRSLGESVAVEAAAHDEEAVVDVVPGGDGVRVGAQAERRLRLTRGEHPLGLEAAEHGVRLGAHGGADLAEQVVREAVAGVGQGGVAHGVGVLEAQRRPQAALPGDAGGLGGDPDPRRAGTQELDLCLGEHRRGVEAAGDVQPLDEDGAVEVGGVGRSAHQDAGGVVSRLVRLDGPLPVARERLGAGVRRRRPRDEELLLQVALGGEVRCALGEHRLAGTAGDRPVHGDLADRGGVEGRHRGRGGCRLGARRLRRGRLARRRAGGDPEERRQHDEQRDPALAHSQNRR